jgi:hypothetical protein
MNNSFPLGLLALFTITTIATLVLFLKAWPKTKTRSYIIIGVLGWLLLQFILSKKGFYDDNMSLPPRFALTLAVPLLAIVSLFITKAGRTLIDGLSIKTLTWLQTIRVPVELVLYFLMIEKAIPQLMTFEGRNFDVLSGITAPIAAYFGFAKGQINRKFLLGWNILCLLLVLNIVINAILSIPTPFQQFAFDQPNVAVLKFPFVWLPAFIVPVVIFSHLVSIRQLLK